MLPPTFLPSDRTLKHKTHPPISLSTSSMFQCPSTALSMEPSKAATVPYQVHFDFIRFYCPTTQAMGLEQIVAWLGSAPSNDSTSDRADEHQASIVDERRKRRMISNRESARRSRLRKLRHLDELQSQVVHLRALNQRIIEELNHVMEGRDQVLHENTQLREEASNLQKKLKEMQVETTSAGPTSPK